MIESKSKHMVHTKEELDEMLDAAKPLIKWLNNHSNFHSTILVTPDAAELLWSYGTRITSEFIRD